MDENIKEGLKTYNNKERKNALSSELPGLGKTFYECVGYVKLQ